MFELAGDRVESMKLLQDGQEMVLTRAKSTKPAPAIDLAAIDRVRRSARAEAAMAKMGALIGRGTVRLPQSGVEGSLTIVATADGRAMSQMDFGEIGRIRDVLAQDTAWMDASFSPLDVYRGKFLDQARAGHPLALFGDWSRWFSDVSVLGSTERDGRSLWRVRVGRGEAPPVEVLVDPKTGDPVETRGVKFVRLGGGIPITVRYTDFRSVKGVRLPHRIESEDEPTGRSIITIDRWERFTGDLAETIPATPPAE